MNLQGDTLQINRGTMEKGRGKRTGRLPRVVVEMSQNITINACRQLFLEVPLL